MNTHYASYSTVPKSLALLGKAVYEALREKYPETPLLIAYRGYSGAAFGVAVLTYAALQGDEKISGAYARKENENSHSGRKAEHDTAWKKKHKGKYTVVFVDDFVSSGKTVRETLAALRAEGLLAEDGPWISAFYNQGEWSVIQCNNLGAIEGVNVTMNVYNDFIPKAKWITKEE
jgi:orotate phosphoribosyltransferase